MNELELTAAPLKEPDNAKAVKLIRPRADAEQSNYKGEYAVDGKEKTGWAVFGEGDWHTTKTLTLDFAEPVGHPGTQLNPV